MEEGRERRKGWKTKNGQRLEGRGEKRRRFGNGRGNERNDMKDGIKV